MAAESVAIDCERKETFAKSIEATLCVKARDLAQVPPGQEAQATQEERQQIERRRAAARLAAPPALSWERERELIGGPRRERPELEAKLSITNGRVVVRKRYQGGVKFCAVRWRPWQSPTYEFQLFSWTRSGKESARQFAAWVRRNLEQLAAEERERRQEDAA